MYKAILSCKIVSCPLDGQKQRLVGRAGKQIFPRMFREETNFKNVQLNPPGRSTGKSFYLRVAEGLDVKTDVSSIASRKVLDRKQSGLVDINKTAYQHVKHTILIVFQLGGQSRDIQK